MECIDRHKHSDTRYKCYLTDDTASSDMASDRRLEQLRDHRHVDKEIEKENDDGDDDNGDNDDE